MSTNHEPIFPCLGSARASRARDDALAVANPDRSKSLFLFLVRQSDGLVLAATFLIHLLSGQNGKVIRPNACSDAKN